MIQPSNDEQTAAEQPTGSQVIVDPDGEEGPKSSESLLPTSLLPKSMSATATGVNVRVPPLPGAAAARRLGAEVCAWPMQCAFRVHVMCLPCVFAYGRGAQLPSREGPDPDPKLEGFRNPKPDFQGFITPITHFKVLLRKISQKIRVTKFLTFFNILV